MNDTKRTNGALSHVWTCVRIVVVTMAFCCVLYPLAILAFGQVVTPRTAEGSLIRNDRGEIVGSELIAQGFSRPEYFWPRPSAVGYDAAAAGGSNLSPTNPKVHDRAVGILGTMEATAARPIPADLVTTSGSGLDPHITLEAARFQARRVAVSRGLALDSVLGIVRENAERPGGVFTPDSVVNVLLTNIELDRRGRMTEPETGCGKRHLP